MEPRYCPWMNETVLFPSERKSLKMFYGAETDGKIDLIYSILFFPNFQVYF